MKTMRRLWYSEPVLSLILLWHQSGDDLALFCYRITEGALMTVHQRAIVPLQMRRRAPGKGIACSNPSAKLSIHSMMSRD
jgi:hypothetical protein